MPLYYYREELQEYHDHFASMSHEWDQCREDQSVAGDIKMLLGIFEDLYGQRVRDELERYNKEKPTCTHDMAWMLFKPGSDVYVDFQQRQVYDPAVVSHAQFEYVNGKPVNYDFRMWFLEGTDGWLGPGEPFHVPLQPFTGEKEIASLGAFPCNFLRDDKNGTTHERRYSDLVKRGRMYYNMIREATFLSFDGHSLSRNRASYRGRVMVDMKQHANDHELSPLRILDDTSNETSARCFCPHCSMLSLSWSRRRIHFTDYSAIAYEKTNELEEHQYFLCSRWIPAYFLKHREWSKQNAHMLPRARSLY